MSIHLKVLYTVIPTLTLLHHDIKRKLTLLVTSDLPCCRGLYSNHGCMNFEIKIPKLAFKTRFFRIFYYFAFLKLTNGKLSK